MVDDLDAQDVAGQASPLGQPQIGWTGLDLPRGVVVGEEERPRPPGDRHPEHLTSCAGHVRRLADRDRDHSQRPHARVEQDCYQCLLPALAQGGEKRQDLSWDFERRPDRPIIIQADRTLPAFRSSWKPGR